MVLLYKILSGQHSVYSPWTNLHTHHLFFPRLGFELFLLRLLTLWFRKVYQFRYILKQLVFVLVNLLVSGVFNRKGFKLSRVSLLPYVHCLLLPFSMASVDNYMLQNFVPLLFIATFHCFWIRHNFEKLKSPLFLVLSFFSVIRLFFSIPNKSLFFVILSQCVLYLLMQVYQKRHIFSIYVMFSQVIVFLTALLSPNYNSILDFRTFHVFTRNVVFLDDEVKLYVNIFFQVVLFLSGVFFTMYLLLMDQGEKFRIVNAACCFVVFLHFLYRLLHFMFLDLDNGVSNFHVLLNYLLEYNTVVFILLCVLTTLAVFVSIGVNLKYCHDRSLRTKVRKWFHLMVFLYCFFGFYLKKENFLVFVIALVILGLVFVELFRINNLLFGPAAKFFRRMYKCLGHDDQVDKFEISTITMLSGVLIPMLFELGSDQFDWTRGGLGLFTVTVGDSMASIFGTKHRGNRYNNKTTQGLLAFFLSCLGVMAFTSLIQYGFVDNFRKMFFVSLFSAIFEYVSNEEDNISVPLFAMLLYRL